MSLHAIEHYGHVCALLDDGSGVRAEILSAAGLDEPGWQRLRAECLPMLASNRAPTTAVAFGRAYASARQQLAVPKAAPPQSIASVSVDGDDAEPSAEPRVLDIDCTTGQAFPLAGPALPFRPAAPLTAAQAPVSPRLSMPPRGASGTAAVTLEVPRAAGVANAVLPFSAPAPTGRRQRLLHFEPSTGRRLSPPVWVDEIEFLVEPTGR
jgi:hypothetical protein